MKNLSIREKCMLISKPFEFEIEYASNQRCLYAYNLLPISIYIYLHGYLISPFLETKDRGA